MWPLPARGAVNKKKGNQNNNNNVKKKERKGKDVAERERKSFYEGTTPVLYHGPAGDISSYYIKSEPKKKLMYIPPIRARHFGWRPYIHLDVVELLLYSLTYLPNLSVYRMRRDFYFFDGSNTARKFSHTFFLSNFLLISLCRNGLHGTVAVMIIKKREKEEWGAVLFPKGEELLFSFPSAHEDMEPNMRIDSHCSHARLSVYIHSPLPPMKQFAIFPD